MSPEGKRLLIRTDADARIGTGHVMRCLALAQCWLEHAGPVTLAAERLPDGLRDRLLAEKIDVHRQEGGIAGTIELARVLRPSAVVLDGYHFTSEDERLIHEAGFPVLALDDFGHTTHAHATWILNQNLGARRDWYKGRGAGAKLLLGPRHALLRREFSEARVFRRMTPRIASRILVTMGGADPDNVSAVVLRALAALPPMPGRLARRIDVVVGSSNPHLDELNRIAADFPHWIRLRQNVLDMPGLMAGANLAVTAGGTTCWELAVFGVPMVVLTIAQNQVELAKAIAAAGLAINLGWPNETTPGQKTASIRSLIDDPARRAAMTDAGRSVVDGWGVTRVVRRLLGAPVITLREARPRDCRAVWRWANDPETRGVSFSSEPIPWESHRDWYRRRLENPGCLFLIGFSSNGKRVGMIRFDTVGDDVIVSVNIAPRARGRGIGAVLVRKGTAMAREQFPGRAITAWIMPSNPASRRVFEKAGYADTGLHAHAGRPAHRLVHEDKQ